MSEITPLRRAFIERQCALHPQSTLRQYQVARAVGIPPWRLSKLMTGSAYTPPRPEEKQRLAEYFGLPVTKLFAELACANCGYRREHPLHYSSHPYFHQFTPRGSDLDAG